MESIDNRLRRFLAHEDEVPLTLLMWAQNHLVPQVRVAMERRLDNVIFLSVHAFVQTFSEKALGRRGHEATKYYLQSFMDEGSPDRNFSEISHTLHEMRNVMAHQLFSIRTHDVTLDYALSDGWRQDATTLRVNPGVFAGQFISSVDNGRAWHWKDFVAPERRIAQKYLFVRDWLDLARNDAISQAVTELARLTTLADIESAAASVDVLIARRYGV